MPLKIGFIGLGAMGKPIAVNIANAGFDLTVYDLREEPCRELAALGAKVASSAREVAERSDIVEILVVDDAQIVAAEHMQRIIPAAAGRERVAVVETEVGHLGGDLVQRWSMVKVGE